MKFAIAIPCDQTVAYIAKPDECNGDDGCLTARYASARLWDVREEAERWVARQNDKDDLIIEEVTDETAWRRQGSTW